MGGQARSFSPVFPRLIPMVLSAEVWTFDASNLEGHLPSLERVLTSEESEKARRFARADVRRTYCIGRGMLRLILGARMGCRPEDVCISYNPFGKPELAGGSGPFFNVSHSEDRIAIALGFGAPVGIDVERIRDGPQWPELARNYFAFQESEYIESLPPAERSRAFFEIWTRKEAYVKARGQGLSIPLKAFCVPLGSISESDAPAIEDGSAQWRVRPLAMDGEFAGALVVRTGTRVVHHRAPPSIERATAIDGRSLDFGSRGLRDATPHEASKMRR